MEKEYDLEDRGSGVKVYITSHMIEVVGRVVVAGSRRS